MTRRTLGRGRSLAEMKQPADVAHFGFAGRLSRR
jgi:hypothetical protein